ncbi:MAG: chitobiase/beta-hexosaminidase C-terminal domain-containing protein [Bacteroidales bacterium]|nr:chitobiase/beta-hexosaminidase C-terminal domain-containing protein [Bacteroidales bacterium]MBN2747951.1 chitobiase/beta-hexosaminidase C-terminal domain-containing protein [Bacteroidales bacterium]
MYKGFTGAGNRQVELFINGVSQGTSTPFDDFNEHVFEISNINISGDIIIQIKNITAYQVIIDDISWTAYADNTAPVWSTTYPLIDGITKTSAVLKVSTDEPGKAFYKVLADGAADPTVDDLIATGTEIAIAAGATEYTADLTGLTESTAYDVFVVAQDDETTPNKQAAVTKIDLLTLAADAKAINITAPTASQEFTVQTVNVEFTVDNFDLPTEGKVKYTLTPSGTGSITSGEVTASPINLTELTEDAYTIELELVDEYGASLVPAVTASIQFSVNLEDVANPTFTPVAGTYYSTQNVEITCATADAEIRYTTNGDEPTEASSLYSTPIEVSATTTIKAKAFKAAMTPSALATAAYTIVTPTDVADIAALRASAADNTTVYKLTSAATITQTDGFNNRKYIQDASGAILIYDPNPAKITGTYNVGDGITNVIGKLYVSNEMLRFTPVADAETTSSNPAIAPEVKALDAITVDDEAKLVKVVNVIFNPATGTFGTGKNYTLEDGAANTLVLRTDFFSADYIGTDIPTTSVTLTGVLVDYNGTMQFTPRNLADFQSAVATLTDLKVNDVTVTDFDAATLTYSVELPFGAAVPAVAATATSTSATLDITQATVVDGGIATVLVTAQDGVTTKTYTINFTEAAAKTDATLSALTVNGVDVLAYANLVVDPSTEPGATMWFNNFTDAMGIVATQNDADATVSIKKNGVVVVDPANEPLADNDVILITVTAQDVAVVKYYKITLQQKPIITATAGANGTIAPAGAVAVDYDGTQAFTATANPGYHIAALNVNGTPVVEAANQTAYTYTFNNVVADATIAATFEQNRYTVTFTVKEGTTPLEGATVALSGGYSNQLTNASGVATFTDVLPNQLSYTVTLDGYNTVEGNVTVEGNKNVDIAMVLSTTPTYSVIFTVKEGEVAVEAATVALTGYGEQQTDASGVATFTGVPASADVAYTVNKTGFVEATGAVTVVDADVNQAVALTRVSYTIAASAGENGTITPTGDVSVAHGNNQAFVVEAAAGYHIASLLVNGTEVAEAAGVASYTYTFSNVVADATITATFAINTYTITVTAGENGTTTPATNQTVNHGGEVVFTIAANEGYHIKDVLVDGVSVGAVASYTFTNVTANASIETQFEINTYTISTLVSPVDAGTVTGSGDYTHGQEVTLTATANTGYAFEKWTVGGTTLSTSATYVFTAAENVDVTAVFVQQVTDLFFSEYIEGSSNNKAIEIYNPTGASVDLSIYSVKLAPNGGAWNATPQALTGTLASGEVFVITHAEAGAEIKAQSDLTSTVTYFNGNDALGLFKDDVLIDVIGKQGEDPGTAWSVAGITNATVEYTLVRKGSVTSGNTDWAASAGTDADNSEWIVYPQNTFTYLGTHSTSLSSAAEITAFSFAEQVAAATIDATSGTITIEVVYGTDLTGLVSTFTVSAGAKAYVGDVLQVSGTTDNDFTDNVVYKVVAEDGTIKNWTVTVTMPAQPSTAAEIVSFVLAEQTGAATINSAAGTIAIEVNSTADLTALTPTIQVSAGASISPASGAVQDFTNPVTYTVTAQDNNTTKAWTVTVTKPQVNVVTIAQIQQPTGATGDSPYADQIVETTGIVTAIQAGKGFFIQDGEGAWSGILVYTNTATGLPAIGDEVKVKGWLKEYYSYTEITNNTNPAVTVETTVLSTGNTLPAATVLTSQAVQAEEYEGVLVKVVSAEVISGPSDKQEYIVNDGSGDLTVDDKLFLATFTVGSRYSITGVMDYSFDVFKLLPRDASDIATGIDDIKWGVNLEVYPNPFTNTISFSNVEDVELITVTNLIGQRVMTVKPESSNSINTNNLIKGIYLVSFQNRDGKVIVKKMIKQ